MESQCLELHRNTYKMWLWIFTGVIMISSVLGFSNGNFPQVCRSMAPEHPSSGLGESLQTSPYIITYAYGQKGEPVTVTLQSTEPDRPFKGFMLEARQKGKEDPVGSFIVLDPTKTRILTCTDVSGFAVSQKNNVKKTSIQVNWTTDVFDQDITFRATVLQGFDMFWIGLEVNATLPPTTPVPSTQPTTATSTTSTATTMPSTTSTTETRATSTASTTEPSTTGSTESSTASTTSMTKPSTTGSTESSTTSTTEPSTTGSTESSTTSTTEPSTRSTTSTTEPSTTGSTESVTTSTTEPSTTGRTSWPCCRPLFFWKKVATALVVLDTLFVVMKMELVPSSFQHQVKMSASLCSLMSMAAELLPLVLFCLDGPTIKIIVLVCVVIVVNFTEVLIITRPFELHHKLKGISSQVCSVIHIVFSIAVIFLVLLESDCLWPLIVMIAYTVWLFVFVIWVFFISTRRKAEPGRHNIADSKTNGKSKHQREKKTSTLAKATIFAVSLFFIVGTMAFTAAVIFLVFSPKIKLKNF